MKKTTKTTETNHHHGRCCCLLLLLLASTGTLTSADSSGGCNITSFSALNLACENVEFWSNGSTIEKPTSGSAKIYGALLTPTKGVAPFPTAMIMGGSGPTNMWGTDGQYRTYYDIAVALATEGFAVLVYNKRSCGPSDSYCTQRTYCTPVALEDYAACSACPGCVNVYNITLYDFIADGQAGLAYLESRKDVVNASSLLVSGHSQGCDIVPFVAKQAAGVKHVALFSGGGTTADVVVPYQLSFMKPVDRKYLEYLTTQFGERSVAVQDYIGHINETRCTINTGVEQYRLASTNVTGYYNREYQIPAFVQTSVAGYISWAEYKGFIADGLTITDLDLLGIYPNTTSCMGNEIDGRNGKFGSCLCMDYFVNPDSTGFDVECDLKCQKAQLVKSGAPDVNSIEFCNSWMQVSKSASRASAWADLADRRLGVLTTNGWSDSLVPPVTFAPLQEHLIYNLSAPSYTDSVYAPGVASRGASSLTTKVFSNITHFMTDVSCGYTDTSSWCVVRADVLDAITQWACDNFDCISDSQSSSAAPVAIPSPRPSSVPTPACCACPASIEPSQSPTSVPSMAKNAAGNGDSSHLTTAETTGIAVGVPLFCILLIVICVDNIRLRNAMRRNADGTLPMPTAHNNTTPGAGALEMLPADIDNPIVHASSDVVDARTRGLTTVPDRTRGTSTVQDAGGV